MENKEPTQEQIKEFWEGCGFHYLKGDYIYPWACPNEVNCLASLPPIDLNNLFKYAESLLDKYGEWYITLEKGWKDPAIKIVTIHYVEGREYEGKGTEFRVALFWVIWEVIHNAK